MEVSTTQKCFIELNECSHASNSVRLPSGTKITEIKSNIILFLFFHHHGYHLHLYGYQFT